METIDGFSQEQLVVYYGYTKLVLLTNLAAW
jgi:hypothetical protein